MRMENSRLTLLGGANPGDLRNETLRDARRGAQSLADRVAVRHGGRISGQPDCRGVLGWPQQDHTRTLLAAAAKL